MSTRHPNKDSISMLCFWLMTFAAICILVCYFISAYDRGNLKKQLHDLQAVHDTTLAEKDMDERTISQLNLIIKTYQDKEHEQLTESQKKAQKIKFMHDEVGCLADNIYHESAYEPETGQLAVATVTMNRVADPFYPKTVCGVVYERHIKKTSDKIVCMFSWTCKPKKQIHPSLYQKVLAMARMVYFKHERNEDVADATLYHAAYVQPDWASPNNLVATIGQHLFYRQ